MTDRYQLLFATGNPGKARELQDYLTDLPIDIITLASLADTPTVEEDQPTLAGNARKKADVIHRHTGLPTVADDTGLEVEALDGRPGVHSARFAGSSATDEQNRSKLLRVMEGESNRRARFRTVLAFRDEDTLEYFEGICEGIILPLERGTRGFGYDSVFVPRGREHTFAELSKREKNTISHRGRALRKFAKTL
jgi:XTP/dITP diphosphohydrolase